MRIPSLLIASALLAPSVWGQKKDESPYYFQLGMGGVFSEAASGVPGGNIRFAPGITTSAAVGREWPLTERLGLDTQFEGYYQYFVVRPRDLPAITSAVQDDASAFALMVNGLLDWHFTPQYSMYGGIGVGYATDIRYDAWDSGSLSTTDNSGGAFQALLGFDYNLGGAYDVRLGYRYFKTQTINIHDAITGDNFDLDVAQHSVEATFRWSL